MALVVDHGFDPTVGKTKDYNIINYLSAKKAAFKKKTAWVNVRIMCQSGATCLLTDLSFRASTIIFHPSVLI